MALNHPIAYLGDHVLLTTTKYNRKIYVDGRDISVAPHLLMDGDWEYWVSAFFQRRILARAKQEPKGSIIIDGGANFGWYSLLAHFTVEGHYNVWSFEPNPMVYELLRKTFSINGMNCAQAVPMAVSDCASVMLLSLKGDEMGSSQMVEMQEKWDPDTAHIVSRVALDTMIPPGSRVAIIKLDIEGHEPQALAGAKRILQENPDIELFVEHNPSDAETEILRWLIADGFLINWIGYDANPVLKTFDELASVPKADMLWLHRGR